MHPLVPLEIVEDSPALLFALVRAKDTEGGDREGLRGRILCSSGGGSLYSYVVNWSVCARTHALAAQGRRRPSGAWMVQNGRRRSATRLPASARRK